jgi:hypothetical protein
MRYIGRVKWNKKSVSTPKYLNQDRNNTVIVEIDERLRFAICRDCIDAEIGVRYIRCVEWSGKSVETQKYLNQERNIRVFVEIWDIAFWDLRGLFGRWNWRALRSACRMEFKERLNAEISQSGMK